MKKIDLKISLLFSVICLIGGFFVLPYQIENLQHTFPQESDRLLETMPLPYSLLLAVSSIQISILAFILSFAGIKLARKTGFSLKIIDEFFQKEKIRVEAGSVLLAVVFGVMTAFVLVVMDRFYFQKQIEILGELQSGFSLNGLLAGVFYGGVFEEIMLRLFFMSLIVWLMMKLFKGNKNRLPNAYYWIAIMIASLVFAAGHLPATNMIFGELTPLLIVRCFLLNGIGGLFFGYLYWKKGFEYAVIAHMFTHISLQLLFIPIFY
ncbi:CPBP family intramembrane glutamic endopeptidase [Ureibacillus aquaedulcis]|uniref:CPBP family intramembrane metalloprotease n=1 Tax=Ureibacillus aquaedulcis TaxID=3058421 RepID=A0ABT8GUD0_9BACL|nr:CPBP family intramembrane glutamic endopeptidase [Ureibacillus sp. BA0131]MDN4495030.1 CPBP family intramembrane metalloprotease [Ureibacillus sp. BA0131]